MLCRRKLSGDHPRELSDFLAQLLVIPSIYKKFKLIFHNFKLYMYIAGITSDPAKKSENPRRGSPDDFRWHKIAGPHGMYFFVHLVNYIRCIFLLVFFQSTHLCMDQRFEHFYAL